MPRFKPGSNRQWEAEMLSEWAAKFFPNAIVKERVSLGRIPAELMKPAMTELDLALAGRFRRWADMVIIEDTSMKVVEGMIVASPGKVGQLELYLELVPATPELLPYKNCTLEAILVYCVEDPMVNYMARKKGFRVWQFIPSFYDLWKASIPPRWSHPKRWELE